MTARPGTQRRKLFLSDARGMHGSFLSEVLAEVVRRPVRVNSWEVTGKTREVPPPDSYEPGESVIDTVTFWVRGTSLSWLC